MKKRKITTFIAAILVAAMVMGTLPAVSVEAKKKTVKFLAVTTEKSYYKTSAGKWSLEYSSKSNYNKKGYYLGHESKSYDESGAVIYSYKSVNTLKKNKPKTTKYYVDGKLSETDKYTYKGKKTTIKKYDAKNKYIGKEIETSTKTKWTDKSYDSSGKLTSEYTSTYTKKGVIKKGTGKSYENGKKTWEYTTTYSKGKAKKNVSKSYNNGSLSTTYTTTYSYKKGYTISKTKSSGSNAYSSETKYKVDKAGNEIYSYNKQYDSSGNLISKYTYKNTLYTSGKAKGCLKQSICIIDGKETSKSVYTVKQFKRTETY